MANALPYQSELMVVLPQTAGQRSTLALSATGDLQVVTGKDKLITQIVHALVNDQTLNGVIINSPTGDTRAIRTNIIAILRQFREAQLSYTQQTDPDLTGLSVWRKSAGSTDAFARISGRGVQWKYVDTDVNNGTTYTYGISRIYKNTYESKFIDMLDVTPSAVSSNKTIVCGTAACALNDDRQVTIYVDYNKYFKASEILDKVIEVIVLQDSQEPRKFAIQIQLQNLLGEYVFVSTVKQIAASSVMS